MIERTRKEEQGSADNEQLSFVTATYVTRLIYGAARTPLVVRESRSTKAQAKQVQSLPLEFKGSCPLREGELPKNATYLDGLELWQLS